jgi:2-isopropylmalate synthase
MLPAEYATFIRYVRQLCPELEQVALSAHCHDDLGLAVANSLAALDAGVQQLECTVNGIGERAGNASLEEIVMAMRVRGDALQAHTEIDVSQIGPASRLVERLTRYPVPPNKAIVGANAFAHEAGIHQDGLLKDVATYQIIDPGELGLAMTLPLGKHSGRHAFSRACSAAGLELDEEELVVAFARFKARADEGGPLSIHELIQEVTLS